MASLKVVRPVVAPITQRWGVVNGILQPGGVGGHPGTDYGAAMGAPIVAVADGVVSFAGYADGFGYHCVSIWHAQLGVTTTYGHGQAHYVATGQPVACGQHIVDCDTQGFSTGPHLHFEVRPLNTPFGGNPPNIDSEAWLVYHLNPPVLPALSAKDRGQIALMQREIGVVTADGHWGKQTDDRMQTLRWKYLAPPRRAEAANFIRALQRDIFKFAPEDQDAIWGPKTDAAYQLARLCWLNK